MIISLYMDDMLTFETDEYCVNNIKRFMSSVFNMKDLGVTEVIIGIKIIWDDKEFVISQSGYIEKVLKKFNMLETISASTQVNPNLSWWTTQGVKCHVLHSA